MTEKDSDCTVCISFCSQLKKEISRVYCFLGSELRWFMCMFFVAAASRRQEERISVPAAGVHGDGQQSQLEIQIRVGRVRLLFLFHLGNNPIDILFDSWPHWLVETLKQN